MRPSRRFWVFYLLVQLGCALGNIAINYEAKLRAFDLYPFAELVWLVGSIAAPFVARRGLVRLVVGLLLLDAWVDLCAMGHASWWAGHPLLVEWCWHLIDPRLLRAYWALTWGVQVPLRCFAIALVMSQGAVRPLLLVAAGLNLIWLAAPQDVLFYFVWRGLYDARFPYFHYLPPEGAWNLWTMLLLRLPIGVGLGALVIRAGRQRPAGAAS